MTWGWVKAPDGLSYAKQGTKWAVEKHWATGKWSVVKSGGVMLEEFDSVMQAMAEAERLMKGQEYGQ